MSKIDRPTIKATLINDVKLAEIEKKAKAFDIIRKYGLDIHWFKNSAKDYKSVVEYSNEVDIMTDEMTQEEFEFLKEMIK